MNQMIDMQCACGHCWYRYPNTPENCPACNPVEKNYAHMCRDGHVQIGHNDSEHEQCPLCRAQAALVRSADFSDGRDLSGKEAEDMAWTAKAALSSIA